MSPRWLESAFLVGLPEIGSRRSDISCVLPGVYSLFNITETLKTEEFTCLEFGELLGKLVVSAKHFNSRAVTLGTKAEFVEINSPRLLPYYSISSGTDISRTAVISIQCKTMYGLSSSFCKLLVC